MAESFEIWVWATVLRGMLMDKSREHLAWKLGSSLMGRQREFLYLSLNLIMIYVRHILISFAAVIDK